MFGIGLPELLVIVIVAIFVFGPDKLPDLARQAGQMVRHVRRLTSEARDELRKELGPEYSDLELTDLDPRRIVKQHIKEAIAELDAEEAAAKAPKPLLSDELPPYDLEAT